MNYGKRHASKKQKNISSKAKMSRKKAGVRLFKGLLLCCILLCIAGVAGGLYFMKQIIDEAPAITPESIKPQGYTSIVYSDDGVTETERFITAGSNRVYKTLDEVPVDLQNAFIAVEDSRFYSHNGIDPQGIVRAFVTGITSGGFSQGASTITQQLIKNNVFPDFVNEETFYDKLQRKIQEWYLAIQIEQQLSKEEILESYLNTINLGQNTLGVQAAAQRYFGKDVAELTLSESATIAGITKNPGRYNPVTNPEDNMKRRTKVLDDMLEQGLIEQAAHDEAMADDVYARIQNVNTQIKEESSVTSYFNDALVEQLMEDFTSPDGLGYTNTQAVNAIYSGGLSIYSTQNLTIQGIVDKHLNNDANYPSKIEWGLDYALTVTRADGTQENYSTGHVKKFRRDVQGGASSVTFGSKDAAQSCVEAFKAHVAKEGDLSIDEYMNLSPQPQCAVTVIDQATGQIKALTGGRGAKTTNRGLNRAYTGSVRQPGSTMKIVAVYAPALDSAGMSLATMKEDKSITYTGTSKSIKNAYSGFKGPMTLRTAIIQSCNTVAVQVMQDISVDLGYEYSEKFGISTLVDYEERNGKVYTDKMESLALGGVTDGVYNFELCAAYATVANAGVYNEPILYTKVLDHDGNILFDKTEHQETRTVLKDTTAALLTSAMQDVVKSGTGTAAKLSKINVAGKTGTTSDRKDIWFCGYTPYYTCSIWMGYDEPEEIASTYWNIHAKLWKKIMDEIHSTLGLSNAAFKMPSSLTKKTVCKTSGFYAGDGCTETITELFAPGTLPNKTCEECIKVEVTLCCATGLVAGNNCPLVEHKEFAEDEVPTKVCTTCQPTPPVTPPSGGDGGTDAPSDGGGADTPPSGGGDSTGSGDASSGTDTAQ